MSLSFRLRYILGLIPTAKKIDSDWADLLKMRDRLQLIENSKELARFNELNSLIQSSEFQFQKKEIQRLKYEGSPEYQTIRELTNLEKSKPIKGYSVTLKSSQLERFQKIAGSKELQRYEELKEIVESSTFQHRKKELEDLKYKGSLEYQKRMEFISLGKNGKLKLYYKTLESSDYLLFKELNTPENKKLFEQAGNKKNKDPKLALYLKFQKSKRYENLKIIEHRGLAKKFEHLKHEVNADSFLEKEAFLKDANRYKGSKDYPVFKEFTHLAKSEDIQFFLKFKVSPQYMNYEKVSDSWELTRLKELREMAAGTEFIKRVNYLKDKKRYESSERYKSELEFIALDKSELMKEYRLLKKSAKLDFFNKWNVVFDEDFGENKLNTNRWQPENYWGFKLAGRSFSQTDEIQCYNGLNNILVNSHVLSILTKREKVAGQVWNSSTGLMPKQFEYSSGIINSGESFRMSEGVVEAKVKFNADSSVTSAFSLTGSVPLPQIDVFRSGKDCVTFGTADKKSNGLSAKYKRIYGLKFDQFHVFRLEIKNNTLIWKINGQEVHTEQFFQFNGGMFLNFVSSLHETVNHNAIPHRFEIDWVRCYQEKN
jgi:beta-glucanase (GH16 family)